MIIDDNSQDNTQGVVRQLQQLYGEDRIVNSQHLRCCCDFWPSSTTNRQAGSCSCTAVAYTLPALQVLKCRPGKLGLGEQNKWTLCLRSIIHDVGCDIHCSCSTCLACNESEAHAQVLHMYMVSDMLVVIMSLSWMQTFHTM